MKRTNKWRHVANRICTKFNNWK